MIAALSTNPIHGRTRGVRARSLRRGAVLLEIVVAMAIFVGTGLLTLSMLGNSYDGLDRAHQNALANDLARSRLAEIEAGLMSIGDMQRELIERIGSFDLLDSMEYHGLDDESSIWRMRITTSPTQYRGLTLVEVQVYRLDVLGNESPSATLRQLIALREPAAEEYLEDEAMTGLRGGGRIQ